MEQWDAYDKDGNKLDMILTRGETLPKHVYHLVSEVLVRHEDGDFLLMQRDYDKSVFPGYYEASAGGSALRGESPKEAIIRELREETGITNLLEIKLLSTHVYLDSIFYTFICITNTDKDEITLQKGETIDYRWVSKDEFLAYSQSDECLEPQINRLQKYIRTL